MQFILINQKQSFKMKKNLFLAFSLLFLYAFSFAQNNSFISYQMVVRNAANELVVNQSNIGVTITLLNDNNGPVAYSEKHTLTSNSNGLISFFIGNGTVLSGSMSAVTWEKAYIKVSVQIPGETAVEVKRPISSVPRALYADDVDHQVIGDYLLQNHFTDSAFVMTAIPDSISAFINDSGYLTAESQILDRDGDTISLTGGSFVVLPINKIENQITGIENTIDSISNDLYDNIDTIKNNIATIEYVFDSVKTVLYNEIDSLKDNITVLENDIDSLENAIDSLASVIDDLLTDFNDLQHSVCLPRAQTNVVDNITEVSATCGGSVISYCGTPITERGICYSLQPDPTVAGLHVACGNGNGGFSAHLTGLQGATTYYYRSYAISDNDTIYGTQESFTTVKPCGQLTITDVDSNIYSTVQIGVQCWMKENMRTTRYSDGTEIAYYNAASTSLGYYYDYNHDAAKIAQYGMLYDWNAATRRTSSAFIPSGVRGVCPKGWHVPSDKEWDLLKQTLNNTSSYKCGNSVVAALCKPGVWTNSSATCTPGYSNTPTLNASGFSAVPSGTYYNSLEGVGTRGTMWTATDSGSIYPFGITSSSTSFYSSSSVKQAAISVRCLRYDD